jgi:hypothetical protein
LPRYALKAALLAATIIISNFALNRVIQFATPLVTSKVVPLFLRYAPSLAVRGMTQLLSLRNWVVSLILPMNEWGFNRATLKTMGIIAAVGKLPFPLSYLFFNPYNLILQQLGWNDTVPLPWNGMNMLNQLTSAPSPERRAAANGIEQDIAFQAYKKVIASQPPVTQERQPLVLREIQRPVSGTPPAFLDVQLPPKETMPRVETLQANLDLRDQAWDADKINNYRGKLDLSNLDIPWWRDQPTPPRKVISEAEYNARVARFNNPI